MPYVQLQPGSQYAASPEQQVFFIEKGEGNEAILFIHGWHQNARDCFGPYLDNLQHYYRIVAPDLPGHGKSYKVDSEDYSHTMAYYTCKQALDTLADAGNVTVVGHSMGAFLALKLALLEKKKVNNLVLISPVIDYGPYENILKKVLNQPTLFIRLSMLRRALSDKFPFSDRRHIYRTELGHRIPGRYKHFKFKQKNHPLHCALGYMRSFIGCSLMPLVKNNHLPTLLIYGEHDNITPAEFGTSLASLMPQAILRLLPGAHNVHLERKDEVIQLINDFIEDNRKRFFGLRNLFRRRKNSK